MKALKFNAEMAQAVKDGRKTQTRRPIKPALDTGFIFDSIDKDLNAVFKKHLSGSICRASYLTPPYKIGDTHDVDGTQIKITGLRVERLQDISEEDAIAEGVQYKNMCVLGRFVRHYQSEDPKSHYKYVGTSFKTTIWDKLPYEPPYDWNSNPYVWVIEFEVVCD